MYDIIIVGAGPARRTAPRPKPTTSRPPPRSARPTPNGPAFVPRPPVSANVPAAQGGLQRGPRRGGAPNRPPLPPREAATLRGRESARRRSREPSPTHYIIILNH